MTKVFEVVWHGAMVSPWGEKGSLIPPYPHGSASTWQLVEAYLYAHWPRMSRLKPIEDVLDVPVVDEVDVA